MRGRSRGQERQRSPRANNKPERIAQPGWRLQERLVQVPSRLVFSFGGASRDWLASTSVFDLLDGAQRPPNLIRRILLYAMNPPHPNLALVQPRAVEVDLAPDQKSTGSAEIGSSGISLVDIHLRTHQRCHRDLWELPRYSFRPS